MNEQAKQNITWRAVDLLASNVADEILKCWKMGSVNCYPIPRGGIYAAMAVSKSLARRKDSVDSVDLRIVDNPDHAEIYIDDIIDSGRTKKRFIDKYGKKPFFSLAPKPAGVWVVFPWEKMCEETGPEENISRILQYIGEDGTREGLVETPSRVIRAYDELFAGYKMDISSLVKKFEDKNALCDEMIISKDIEFYSMCEHHMLPFFGKAAVAYIPGKSIIGLSKLARIVDAFSKRLQVQEKLTTQITKAIDDHLDPKGSACVIEAQHFCCMARGVGKQSSVMKTSSLTGVFRQPEVRSEFFSLIK